MASIMDTDFDRQFSSKLEEIRSKLLDQAVGELMDTAIELCHVQQDFVKKIKDTCAKKTKEDETIFETIQKYKSELEKKQSRLVETRHMIPEVVSDREEKEMQKESMMAKINILRGDQAKRRELIVSQNKANKDKLKNLNTSKQVFQDWLGLEIRKIHGEKLQFVFRNVNGNNPEEAYTFVLRISEAGMYQVVSCDPALECISNLESKLHETNNFSAFLANIRKEFQNISLKCK